MNMTAKLQSVAGDGETVLSNATIVTADEVISGTVVLRDGLIAEVDSGVSALPAAVDVEQDLLIPGLVELHTDNLERHVCPRPAVVWPTLPALMAHDAEAAGAGITTVFDALRLGTLREQSDFVEAAYELAEGIAAAQADGMTRAEHFVHMRCEVSCDGVAEEMRRYMDMPRLRLVSVMDHTPGQRQFADLAKYREYYGGKYGFSEAELEAFIAEAQAAQERNSARNRGAIVASCVEHGVPLASHDDANAAHVDEALADGAVIAEFPTTHEAADACAEHGLHVLMGAPNVVRGRSHSGNVSALALAQRGVLDILSSDYVPGSLLQAALKLNDEVEGITLPQAIATMTRHPAAAVGLDDRGEIAVGKRADVVRVARRPEAAVVRGVWTAGRRVG